MSNVADLDVIASMPVPADRRNASISTSHHVDGVDASVMAMASGVHTKDAFSTVVDLIAPVPHAHFLLVEGGAGYIVLEDGGRTIIF